jgi:hypothetical protein
MAGISEVTDLTALCALVATLPNALPTLSKPLAREKSCTERRMSRTGLVSFAICALILRTVAVALSTAVMVTVKGAAMVMASRLRLLRGFGFGAAHADHLLMPPLQA